VSVQNEDGSTNLIKGDNLQQREAVAKKLLTPGRARYYTGPKIVRNFLLFPHSLLYLEHFSGYVFLFLLKKTENLRLCIRPYLYLTIYRNKII
jgi:hypothetical protein